MGAVERSCFVSYLRHELVQISAKNNVVTGYVLSV